MSMTHHVAWLVGNQHGSLVETQSSEEIILLVKMGLKLPVPSGHTPVGKCSLILC